MATTTVKVTNYNNLVFSWSETGQSVANNTTTISWTMTLTANGSSGRIDSTKKKPWKVVIDGITYSGTASHGIAGNSTITLASGSTTINHNADGSKTFSFSFMMDFTGLTFAGVAIGEKSGSGTGTLTAIPRAGILVSAPNFTDDENPTITYSNNAGNAVSVLKVCISFDGAVDDIPFREISKTGTSYTFNLTATERTTIRNKIKSGSSASVVFSLATQIGGQWYYSKLYRTVSLAGANPVVSPVFYDTDSSTTTYTGNNKITIPKFSDIYYNLNAVAQKGATITSISVSDGKTTKSTGTGTFADVNSNTLTYAVVDSRGNKTFGEMTQTAVNYIPLTAVIEGELATNGTLTATVKGNYFNQSFGAYGNSLTVNVRYKTKNGSYGSWRTASISKSGNTYTATISITGLDYRTAYVIQAQAIDNMSYITSNELTVSSFPVFDWSESDFNFNVPVSFSGDTSTAGTSYFTGGTVNYGSAHHYGNVYMNGNLLADYVVEQGNKNDWFYRKWNSGIAECWCSYAETLNIAKNSWSGFYYSDTITKAFPFTFVSGPSAHTNGGSLEYISYARTFGQYTDKIAFNVSCLTSSAVSTWCAINMYVIGYWR